MHTCRYLEYLPTPPNRLYFDGQNCLVMSAFNDCSNCTNDLYNRNFNKLVSNNETNTTRTVSGGVVCDFDEIKLGL